MPFPDPLLPAHAQAGPIIRLFLQPPFRPSLYDAQPCSRQVRAMFAFKEEYPVSAMVSMADIVVPFYQPIIGQDHQVKGYDTNRIKH